MREADIQRQILDYFAVMRIPILRVNSGRVCVGSGRFIKFGDEGFPDLLAWPGKGITLAIEVKRLGEDLSPAQAEWRRRLMSRGIQHLVARSIDQVVVKIDSLREAA